ncbi:ATP-binding cassette sub-family A member 5 isoform X1 [Biomphalaria glabrata]|nr:ATP-binding cassette sub-family A member 5 isoform X1 [Biomphalaria glabrata]
MASFWQQLKALLWRNILLKKRNKPQLFQELLFPVYFVILLVFVKNSMKQEKQPAMSFPAINISSFLSYSLLGGYIYVSPNTSQVKNRMDAILAELQRPISYEMFSSSKAAEAKYKSNTSRVAAGIIFDYDQNSNSYAIRMNSIYVPDTKVLFNNIPETCRSDKNGTATSYCDVNTYMHNGFTSLQLAIDKILMKELKMNTTNPTISLQLMDKPELSPKTNNIQTHSSVYFVLSFSVLANFLAVNIVAEKENKIKEGMLMMGLRSSVFWLSWTLIYFSMVVVASGLMIVVIVANKLFSQSSMFLLFLMFVLYGWSSITFAFMITPFFKKAALAGLIAGYSPVIISLVNLAVSQTREEGSYDANIPIAGQWLMCLISTIAFSTVISQGIFLDVHRTGFGFDSSLTYGKFPLYAPILMLAVDTILYALLTVYFDHVIPGEYGIRYKPYYFLQCSYWFKSRKSDEMIHLTSPQMSFSQTSDVEAVPKEIEDKIAMRISHLTKTFKQGGQTFNAVDGFCLNIYENHITCLLGHNGAGKTTLFNMLTGFVPPTSGTAKLLQLDITNTSDLEKITSQCGICPQHNLLYDAFSCIEHLKLFANIKGVSPNNIKQEIEAVLQDVDLTLQAGMFAKDLSGGQRRKLSVAIALIGHPKLIFLDEPTAGMDPFSRRHLWSLLKKMKAGRAILLTTHFMDEADILADRKAFMSKGKLRCCGSSLFLKNKFGIGYHLTMVVTPDCEVSLVTSLLQSKIPDVILQRSHGKEVSYTIPLKDVSKFSDLFAHLDQESNNLGIKSYGVSMATLEEVFLKLEELSEIESETDEIMTFATNSKLAGVNVPAPVQAITSLGNSVLTGAKLSRQRFKTLLWIRYLMIRRNIQVLEFTDIFT